jgi:signal transduction histidine kinase
MRPKLYNLLIKPISQESDQAEREVVLNFLLVGVLGLAIVSFIVTLMAPVISHEPAFPSRLLNNFLTIAFIVGIYCVARYLKQYRLVAVLLTGLIAAFGLLIGFEWGILDPHSVLLLSLATVMAGILIGSRYSIYLAVTVTVVLTFLQHGQSVGSLNPDLSWMKQQPVPGDVVAFAAILLVIALVSWLFNRQMESSLRRARRSEEALKRQKALLEIKVEKRARQLEQAQIDKVQQLYRFAELGQLSTALFHDLANHLSTVNVDIEGLKAGEQPDIMRRIQQNVGHINSIVKRVRQQIGGKHTVEIFDVMHEIDEVVKILASAADHASVKIEVVTDQSIQPGLSYKGDITRFRQVILNLISNGIEAYPDPDRKARPEDRPVTVNIKRQNTTLFISVTDYGLGIPPARQAKIFEPFYTTKEEGVGIGLFVVSQVVDKDLGGELTVTSSKQQGTTFTISMPHSYYAAAKTPKD